MQNDPSTDRATARYIDYYAYMSLPDFYRWQAGHNDVPTISARH